MTQTTAEFLIEQGKAAAPICLTRNRPCRHLQNKDLKTTSKHT